MADRGLLFIPDISGFTKFVSETEIEHSRYIIEELLENIINSNEIGLNISEIEGDAILFYRFGESPSSSEICRQVERMFCNFQKQIKNYELRRVCPCAACKGAVNLTLKIITHYGEFSTYKVKEYNKLIGKDIIIAHRLLKNEIQPHEYWLATNNLLAAKPSDEPLPYWMVWQEGKKPSDGGEIDYKYSILTRLKETVEPDPVPDLSLGKNKVKIVDLSKIIDADIMTVFALLGDFSLRPKWVEGLKGVDQVSHPIYHVGIRHRCILDKQMQVRYTSSFHQSNDTISLTETDDKKTEEISIMLRSLPENKTAVLFEFYIKKNFLQQLILSLFFKRKLEKLFEKSLQNFASFCQK